MTVTATARNEDRTDADSRKPANRMSRLLDNGSLVPLSPADDSGVLTAKGRIDGNTVVAYCTDATRMGGALGRAGCARIVRAIGIALEEKCPVLGLWQSGGARLAEGVESLDAVGQVFSAMTHASGRVPQISIVLGPAAGGAAYGPALTDLVIMAPAGRVFVTGPDVVRSVTGEQIDQEGLGGAVAHGTRSGVVHMLAESEADAYNRARELTGLLTQPGIFDPRTATQRSNLRDLLPQRSNRAYDVKPLIHGLLDASHGGASAFEEIQAGWARNIVVGLGRLGGGTVGVIANNPLHKGGCLDSISAEKAARFVRMCDSFGIPLVVVADVPGYLPGVAQEWEGVVRRGAKLLHAFADAVVPRVTLVTRKAYGGAFIAMNSRSLGATAVFAWPQAETAVMGAQAAVGILHRKRLAATPEPERAALLTRLVHEHEHTEGGVGRAVAVRAVDGVIDPSDTRRALIQVLATARSRRGTHHNIPL